MGDSAVGIFPYERNPNPGVIEMKQAKPANGQTKTLDVLVEISDLAVGHRFVTKTPKLVDVARAVSLASRLLRFDNMDERIETENAAVLALAKRRSLLS
jgi:hypothetical protein